MKKGKKIVVGVLVCLLAVSILLIAATLIVPRFIDRGAVGGQSASRSVEAGRQGFGLNFFEFSPACRTAGCSMRKLF
jgi:hypothetical protein